jgi:hypothetical protein
VRAGLAARPSITAYSLAGYTRLPIRQVEKALEDGVAEGWAERTALDDSNAIYNPVSGGNGGTQA